jgi:TolA-binding protein
MVLRHSTWCLTLSCTLLTACAGLQEDVDQLERSVRDLRSLQAEHTTQLAALQQDVRGVQGRLEELEYAQSKRFGSEVDSLKSAISTLKRRVPPPSIVPVPALEQDEGIVGTLPGDVSTRFGKALELIRDGNFFDAVPLLQSALDASAGQSHAANILFWLGVAYDGVGDNRNALLAYNQIVTVYARHPRVPLTLLRQAAVFQRLGDAKMGKLTLKKLVTEYPGSPEAVQASRQLRD